MKAKLNVDFEFLKNIRFDHKYFSVTDSNDVTLSYGSEYISNAQLSNGGLLELHPNTLTVYAPRGYGAYKYEFPDLAIKGLDFDCWIPNTTKGTLMCDLEIEFAAQSKLMNGDITTIINDTIPITYYGVDEMTLYVDPSSGDILLDFDEDHFC